MRAGNLRTLCELKDTEGNVLTVEPYAIFANNKKRKSVLVYVISGSPETQPGWRVMEARFVASSKKLDQTFTPRAEYDPFNKGEYPVMQYSIPTHDNRQRWTDQGPGSDVSALRTHTDD